MWWPLAASLQFCDPLPTFDVTRTPVEGYTFTWGVKETKNYRIQCAYYDTRGLKYLEDFGEVTFTNYSDRNRYIRYSHWYNLGVDFDNIDWNVSLSPHTTMEIEVCPVGRKWHLQIKGLVWRNTTTTVNWDAVGFQTADFNEDGEVDGLDLGLLLESWGTSDLDITGDNIVDGADLGVLFVQWTT